MAVQPFYFRWIHRFKCKQADASVECEPSDQFVRPLRVIVEAVRKIFVRERTRNDTADGIV